MSSFYSFYVMTMYGTFTLDSFVRAGEQSRKSNKHSTVCHGSTPHSALPCGDWRDKWEKLSEKSLLFDGFEICSLERNLLGFQNVAKTMLESEQKATALIKYVQKRLLNSSIISSL